MTIKKGFMMYNFLHSILLKKLTEITSILYFHSYSHGFLPIAVYISKRKTSNFINIFTHKPFFKIANESCKSKQMVLLEAKIVYCKNFPIKNSAAFFVLQWTLNNQIEGYISTIKNTFKYCLQTTCQTMKGNNSKIKIKSKRI